MHILFLSNYFHPHAGGVETFTLLLGKELVNRGLNVTVMTSNTPKIETLEEIYGIKVLRFPVLLDAFNTPVFPHVIMKLCNLQFDIIHLNMPSPFLSSISLPLVKLRNKPFIITYHNDPIWPVGLMNKISRLYCETILRGVLRLSIIVVATTKSYANNSQYLKSCKNLVVIPNGIDVSLFDEDDFEVKKHRILFVGRLEPRKGVSYLIDAFRKVKNAVPDSELVLFGDGPELAQLNAKIVAYGLESSVKIEYRFDRRKIENLKRYYKSSEIFVLPSIDNGEGFGLVLLEAMYHGLSIVACNLWGPSEIVLSNNCGLVVPPRDSEELANALIRILESDRLKEIFGKNGREAVLSKYTVKHMADKYLDLYYKFRYSN